MRVQLHKMSSCHTDTVTEHSYLAAACGLEVISQACIAFPETLPRQLFSLAHSSHALPLYAHQAYLVPCSCLSAGMFNTVRQCPDVGGRAGVLLDPSWLVSQNSKAVSQKTVYRPR